MDTWCALGPATQRRGHVCATARAPADMEAALRQDPTDVVILDLQTLGSEVFHAARAIRAWPDARQAQALLVTILTPGWVAGHERCLAAGIDWCCSPPVLPEDLVAAAERLAARYLFGDETPPTNPQADAPDTCASPLLSSGIMTEAGLILLERDLLVFDREQALHHCFGSELILRQMAAYLLDHADRELEEIRVAVRLPCRDALRTAAHRLKGTVLHLGAPRAALALKRLEQLPWSDDMADAAAAVDEAARQVQRLKHAVQPLAAAGEHPDASA